MKPQNGIDFSTLLASTAHDMKNSLSLILSTLDELSDGNDNDQPDSLSKPIDLVRYEAKRVNNDLVSLLTLYRLESEHISPRNELYSVNDFLEEQLLYHHSSLQLRKIDATVNCDETLEWVFDQDLLGTVFNNLINNALRYTQQKILLRAEVIEKQLCLSVEDDGSGYPQPMLEQQPSAAGYNINHKSGSTGLGLHFSQVIAEAHHNGDKRGHIKLSNDSGLGGGKFSIFLPNI